MEKRKNIKVSPKTYQMLQAGTIALGLVAGERPTYDKLLQAAIYALAEKSEYKKEFPGFKRTLRKIESNKQLESLDQ
ncbi:MAG: hypothetical protein K0Q87_1352 [Neobacillus sp.]|nr:hypothetical protein [Neobacillus sp.]